MLKQAGMIGQVRKKLNSETGSTMLIALFFFLVCMLIGAAMLSAGVASAGRSAKITETDRRYYNLNSAVAFMTEKIDGQTITITAIKSTNKVTKTPMTINADGNTERGTAEATENASYSAEMSAADTVMPAERGKSLLTDMALDYVFGDGIENFNSSIAWEQYSTVKTHTAVKRLDLVHSDENLSSLNLKIEAELQQDGTLMITITDNEETGYSIKLIFSADISVKNESTIESLDKTITKKTETSYTELLTEKNTEEKQTEISWSLKKIIDADEDD